MTPSETETVDAFFSRISGDYDAAILRAIAPYRDILQTLLDTLPFAADAPLQIVDLGCGTGNLSRLLAQTFPRASFTLVDLSPEMLEATARKLQQDNPQARLTLIHEDFTRLSLPEASQDLIVSSFALHHIPKPEQKKALYAAIARWLRPGGLFRCADGCLGVPHAIYELHTRHWTSAALAQGASQTEVDLWLAHEQNFDHFEPLVSHLDWLEAAGLRDVDCYWRKYLWAVFGAGRAASAP
ncbi:MAG: class I SAM-dependent methyltransferase [Vampirovibrionales bacterium]|nr:class I SAM-dependent methyltransferase [Vampirovibrionales bacterium]